MSTAPNIIETPPPTPVNLRLPGAVLLLSCYEMGHQPQGIAGLLPVLKTRGYRPEAVDLSLEDLPPDKVRRANFVGISVPMHTALRLGMGVIRQVRELNPTCHICVYGLYASLNRSFLLENGADSCIGGTYEESVAELLDRLTDGSGRPEPVARPLLRRSPVRVPQRGTLPSLSRYAHVIVDDETRVTGYVEASRGCLHLCRHCPIPPVYGGRFFVAPPEIVMEDIRQQVAAGARHITFGDPDFLNGPGHAMRLARLLHHEFPGVTFDCTTKIEHILQRPALFPELRECGCIFIVSAVESLSDTVLRILDKGHTRKDVVDALAILNSAGIAMRPTWLPFTPWTTLEDYLDLFQFVEDHDLIDHVDPVQYSVRLLLPPGSLLLDRPEMQPYLGPLIEENFSYEWRAIDERMDRLASAVARLVEEAASAEEDPADTFYRIWLLAASFSSSPPHVPKRQIPPGRKRPPRLTEPWFC
ncbi:MAG: CUAEP/CCAEP-tail radical SAM protein [Armatimonadota bacterium]|nr:CUAEP/CCAEP-tail radical SAM protein [Armatimonadota bacterium]